MDHADTAAFAEAVGPHMEAMYRLAARLATPARAEDVVQDALVRAWRHRATYDSRRGSFRNWCLAIVANESRRRRRAAPIVLPAAHLDAQEIEERLDIETAVGRLPARQRLAVDCYYFADLSITETSAAMGCSEGTVKSTLADARSRLRRDLGLPR